jgi:hypothetical protein
LLHRSGGIIEYSNELSSDPLERYIQLRNDKWLFLKHCIFTKDEVDAEQPIKPYPSHFLYAKFIVLMWDKHKKIAIPKSRRMTISWTCLALIVHDIVFFKGRSWAVTSRKEEAARELVSRCEFMIKSIPPAIISPDLIPKMKRDGMQTSPPVIEFADTHSRVQGFPQGGNQLRQYGFSGIFEDECAFQEESEDTYVAAEPTIRGGGRFIKVSSRAIEDGGFFKRIVFDQIDAPNIRFPEIAPVPVKSPMEGVEVWKNPRNGFLVIDLHYTANPAKRGVEFREGLRQSLPTRRFRMEYEKSWETFEGKPVYEDFNENIHVTKTQPKVHVGLPLLIGWDSSGLTPAAVIGQLQGETLVIICEIMGMGMGASRFVPHVATEITTRWPQITDIAKQTISFFDPAGFKRNEITEETYLSYMIKGGFKQIRPGPMTWKKRVESVVEWFTGMAKGAPKFLVYEQDCPTLVAGLKGGFRYADSMSEVEPDKIRPVKDIHSHPNDALQYMCGGLKSYRHDNYDTNVMPVPTYGFQKTLEGRPALKRRYE